MTSFPEPSKIATGRIRLLLIALPEVNRTLPSGLRLGLRLMAFNCQRQVLVPCRSTTVESCSTRFGARVIVSWP